ncbi:SGNH/GDSL hydrolase family protein [Streptomyces sp. L2]|uniref:SGNH/GDSL hydrolase family protein n=1 Tax=Streptomyces sp. L2 TaxID=2162665 RepID=UPI0010110E20|nr:SGNH/GDSL hydrolase family protein [Streptomyces sp. L2]
MTSIHLRKTLGTLLAGLVMSGMAVGPGPSAAAAVRDNSASADHGGASREPVYWVGAWAAAQEQATTTSPAQARSGFAKHSSLRQIVRVSTGGDFVRIHLSNLYGRVPLQLAGATIARAGSGAALQRGSQRNLTFGHRQAVSIASGAERSSDPLTMRTTPFEKLTVTLYFAARTGPATYHKRAMATSYVAADDHRVDPTAKAFTQTSQSWYYLTGVDVRGRQARQRDGVVTLGDSITDGYGSTVDANNRYPDELAERLARQGRPRPVINAGQSGNELLHDTWCYGESGINRFRRDVATRPGVRTVLLLEGINDIHRSGKTNICWPGAPSITAADLIRGERYLIWWAHTRGLRVIGGTLLPCSNTGQPEAVREAVNSWIRSTAGTSGGYDAIVDFDRALADPGNPHALRPAYDSGDHLHPNDAGYRAMAQAVDISQL